MRELEQAILDIVRRWGRRGINEATIWTAVHAQRAGTPVQEVTAAVERMVTDGRLYRNRRRTRTMIQLGADTRPGSSTEGSVTLF